MDAKALEGYARLVPRADQSADMLFHSLTDYEWPLDNFWAMPGAGGS